MAPESGLELGCAWMVAGSLVRQACSRLPVSMCQDEAVRLRFSASLEGRVGERQDRNRWLVLVLEALVLEVLVLEVPAV